MPLLPPGATPPPTQTPTRRGRPLAAEMAQRRDAVLDAAMAELLDVGFECTTMLSVARRAGASKETLYRWFGSREGMLAALIERNADTTIAGARTGLAGASSPRELLVGIATSLQTLLFGPTSVVLNRLAMGSPPLRPVLLEHGRMRSGALLRDALLGLMNEGVLRPGDPEEAFQVLYGLALQDVQIRVLLGDEPPDAGQIQSHAIRAVDRFLILYAPEA